jgi:hypothetical protein
MGRAELLCSLKSTYFLCRARAESNPSRELLSLGTPPCSFRYPCTWAGCGKRFLQSHHLKRHTLMHTGGKPYGCVWVGCGKCFSTSGSLKRHILTHTGEKPYECTHKGCGEYFSQSCNLKAHVLTHTGEKPYPCTWESCKKRFSQPGSLKKHTLTHTGEKPHACTWAGCEKRFSTSGSQKRHTLTHQKSMASGGAVPPTAGSAAGPDGSPVDAHNIQLMVGGRPNISMLSLSNALPRYSSIPGLLCRSLGTLADVAYPAYPPRAPTCPHVPPLFCAIRSSLLFDILFSRLRCVSLSPVYRLSFFCLFRFWRCLLKLTKL